MFSNIGKKIQVAGMVFCWLGILLSPAVGAVVGYIMVSTGQATNLPAILSGILTTVLTALLSWVGSFAAIGFGKLVENSEIIAASLNP